MISNEPDLTRPILVTGAAGFIGWTTSRLLLDQGHTVVGVDNLNDAYDPQLKRWRLDQLEGRDGFAFHHLDITDFSALRDLFASYVGATGRSPLRDDRSDEDVRDSANVGAQHAAPLRHHEGGVPFAAVVNLAARAGVRPSVENPWIYYDANVTGTLNLLELCREHGVDKFVLASTSSVYGENERPFSEDQPTDRPLSPYAASKKAAEALCYTYHRLYAIDMSIVRYFTVYGPAGRPDMSVFRFIQWIDQGQPLQLYGDGTQQRDFTYVDDIARGTIAALAPLGYEIVNLGGDRPVAINDIIAQIEDLLGKRAEIERHPRHPADVPATWADIAKARRLLDWAPQTDLATGLERAVAWYRDVWLSTP